MITHPTAAELLDAVEAFTPGAAARDAFLARVAENARAIVEREREQGPTAEAAAVQRLTALLGHGGDFEALNAELCEKLALGDLTLSTPGLLDHLRNTAIAQVLIDQPNYSGLTAFAKEV